MTLVDSHCHIDFAAFDKDRAQVIESCQKAGVLQLIVPAVSRQSWPRLLDICLQYEALKPALGLHPMFMAEHHSDDIDALDKALAEHSPIAVGEIGLDFYHGQADKSAQTALFEAQINLAKKYDLAVILHVRKAHDEVLKILRKARLKGGVAHAFSGSAQQAQQYIDLGFKLGVGGALTYDRAHKLQQLFSTLPAESIVLETDSPDMPLMGKQGQRNSPENIPLILAKLAEIRSETQQQLAAITSQNCQQLFHLT